MYIGFTKDEVNELCKPLCNNKELKDKQKGNNGICNVHDFNI